jgi:hypothetical protein
MILTGLGVAGFIATISMAIRATPKAMQLIEAEEQFRWEEESDDTPLAPIEIVEIAWKPYVPTILMGVTTIGCMIAANHISSRRNAALASLFSVAEASLREYQSKVVETIGEKKEDKLRSEIVQDKLDKTPADAQTIILTGKGNYLCRDSFSGRYFRSDIEQIKKSVNVFNQHLLLEGWLGINEFYYELGLESIELGDEMGWIAERGLLEPKFTTALAKDGEPCLVLDYIVTPHHI